MDNVVFFHFAHGTRWVWDERLQEWIAPPRPRWNYETDLFQKLRTPAQRA